MNKKRIVAIFLGIVMVFLGLLWLLQGSDLVHIKPILCFANCEPITGKSLQWQITGVITFVIGSFIIYANSKRFKR